MNRTEEVLLKYGSIPSGQPVLCGHVFHKIYKQATVYEAANWASAENAKNGYPNVTVGRAMNLRRIYRTRHKGRNFIKFIQKCEEVAHCVTPASPIFSSLIEENKKLKTRVCRQKKLIIQLKKKKKLKN